LASSVSISAPQSTVGYSGTTSDEGAWEFVRIRKLK
jgi:hypothetical protein